MEVAQRRGRSSGGAEPILLMKGLVMQTEQSARAEAGAMAETVKDETKGVRRGTATSTHSGSPDPRRSPRPRRRRSVPVRRDVAHDGPPVVLDGRCRRQRRRDAEHRPRRCKRRRAARHATRPRRARRRHDRRPALGAPEPGLVPARRRCSRLRRGPRRWNLAGSEPSRTPVKQSGGADTTGNADQ